MAKKAIRPIRVEGNIAYVPLTRGYEAVIDADDAPLIGQWNWQAKVCRNKAKNVMGVYATRWDSRGMHQMLLKASIVDHVDGNGLNNQRINLRSATRSENARNSRRHRDNTSGFKGVSWNKAKQKWRAYITLNGKEKHLGLFSTAEAARDAYAAANALMHGEFGKLG